MRIATAKQTTGRSRAEVHQIRKRTYRYGAKAIGIVDDAKRGDLLGSLGLELGVEGVTARDRGKVDTVPVAVTKGSATAKGDGEIKYESLAQLSGDSWDGSDGHCNERFLEEERGSRRR